MSEVKSLFDEFLKNIEPTEQAKNFAAKAHNPLREFLVNESDLSGLIERTFLYGSYKRYTATGDIKDVDIVICLLIDIENEYKDPTIILKKLKGCLAKFYGSAEYLEYQRRSIRVDQPLEGADTELTLDIIPAVSIKGEGTTLLVPDREQKIWVKSNPEAHIEFTNYLNSENILDGKFVPLVKMIKHWWKYQYTLKYPDNHKIHPKGFWLEVLTGINVNTNNKDDSYAKLFISILEAIRNKYSPTSIPVLEDPGIPGQNIDTSMTIKNFQFFLDIVTDSLALAIKAISAESDVESAMMWRKIFGPSFPSGVTKSGNTPITRVIPSGLWSC